MESHLFITPKKSINSGIKLHDNDKPLEDAENGTALFTVKHNYKITSIKTTFNSHHMGGIIYVSKLIREQLV